MDWNRVVVFVRVVEAESFTAAAAQLGLPKSSVSRSVTRLEEELGVRLLQRTTRKLSLTDAGRAYYGRVREAMAGLDDATAAVKEMGKDPRGTVRVTAPVDLGVSLLADVVARFVRRYPLIRVELSLSARTVDLVEEGFDLAVRAGPLKDSSLIARRIGATGIALYATPAYLRRRGRPRAVADLASHDCVLFRPRGDKATWQLTGPGGEEESVEVTGPVAADDMAFVQRSVLAGVGIGMIPSFLCTQSVERAELARVLPDHLSRGGPLHVVVPSAKHEPARVALFRDFVVASLAAVPWDS